MLFRSEAERYYKELKERMEKFGLELESSKSRLIEFGRFAEQNRRARGECKPETCDFLGFTFYCSKTRKGGFVPKVQTSRKKLEQKVRAYKNWIRCCQDWLTHFSQGHHGLCCYTQRIIVSLSLEHGRKTTIGGANPPIVPITDKVSPD